MRSRTVRFVSRLTMAVALAAISVFDFLESPVNWLHSHLPFIGENKDGARIILVIATTLVVYLAFVLIDLLNKRSCRSIVDSITMVPIVTIAADGSHDRIGDFRKLRADARSSIYVMGIGATYFSSDTTLLKGLLARNLTVRVLVMSPSVIKMPEKREPAKASNSFAMRVMADVFDMFFARAKYSSDVKSSSERLTVLAQELKSADSAVQLEVRAYPYFLPFNFTAIDIEKGGKVLLEFCIPFSDQRLRMLFSAKEHSDAFKRVIDCAEDLWNKSKQLT